VSSSGYYEWLKRAPKPDNTKELVLIRDIHTASRGTYGARRIREELVEKGINHCRTRVMKLMKEAGVTAKRKRKFKVTTDSEHDLPIAPNLLKRNFRASEANQCWVSDITYIKTPEKWLYLATFIDLYSRKIVGWSMADSLESSLVVQGFRMACHRRGKSPAIVHSDRGIQFASSDFVDEVALYPECQRSMSRKANCWDNAVAESFFGTLKKELVHRHKFNSYDEACQLIFEYIEVFYNGRRLHSYLGYVPPNRFEMANSVAR